MFDLNVNKTKKSIQRNASNNASIEEIKKIAIVGNPNVGKSVLFNNLTNLYAMVSNYPGTTVEVSRGRMKTDGMEYEVIDTPGMYSMSPITEEESVARRILIQEKPAVVVHVVDAKNLERMLPLSLQILEMDLPLILVLNMMDEAREEEIGIDLTLIEERLGIPVIGAVSTAGEGMEILKKCIEEVARQRTRRYDAHVVYKSEIENALKDIESMLTGDYHVTRRSLGMLLLKEDDEIRQMIQKAEGGAISDIDAIAVSAAGKLRYPVEYECAIRLKEVVDSVLDDAIIDAEKRPQGFRERLSHYMMKPLTGMPILLIILYLGLYKFVGDLGAGTVVGLIEEDLFEGIVNPFVVKAAAAVIPWEWLRDLLAGEYGVITLGFRYAVALILPIVTFFFIVFSIIEDSGYLPRLAMLIDRTFKKIGLSGRAVIPMVLGFGCDTMATMVTRTLPTARERVISTMLLALAVPCSAQLGVILALLAGKPAVMLVWAAVISFVFLFIGYLSAKILPGEDPSFYMEVPPLRIPKIANVLTKTYVRVKWYFKEVLPLFIIASVLIWIGRITSLFDFLIGLLRKPVELLGLPPETAKIFLFGFFRRDYGAAGLYDLNKEQALSGVQLAVVCVALTLFLPCIAQFIMNVKERGWKTGIGISVVILLFSFGIAYILNFVLSYLGAVL
ncbi:MAG: ferrous iron transport protein B [Spirochaetes bacterium RBG_16_49_21]|nr:MAG: ferrous iron transport protein B [Spirochaetes bacterium RBG_16_49_21]